MKHSTALSQKTGRGTDFAPLSEIDRSDCQAELLHLYDGFWDDVNWAVEYCPVCDQIVCCVEGRAHWWNYTSHNPKPENLERGRSLAAHREAIR